MKILLLFIIPFLLNANVFYIEYSKNFSKEIETTRLTKEIKSSKGFKDRDIIYAIKSYKVEKEIVKNLCIKNYKYTKVKNSKKNSKIVTVVEKMKREKTSTIIKKMPLIKIKKNVIVKKNICECKHLVKTREQEISEALKFYRKSPYYHFENKQL